MPIKNKNFTRSLLFIPLVLIVLLSMPIAFAGRNSGTALNLNSTVIPENTATTISKIENGAIALAYDSMHLDELGLSENTFNYAIKGFNYLVQHDRLAKDNIISIVDFSLPSTRKRLFVIDLANYEVLFYSYVSHGVNSGKEYASKFSNIPASYQSSLGFYETKNTYFGENGYSLKLEGLEKGINDNAKRRAIVIHGAAYANESFAKAQGYLGRSWGCPALPEKLHKPIIDKIKNGSCLFIYGANNSYLRNSKIINAC